MFYSRYGTGIIERYLKFGSSNPFNYSTVDIIDISLDEAVNEYEKILHSSLYGHNEILTLSGGIDSSLIYSFLNNNQCFCVCVEENTDYDYAIRLNPNTIRKDFDGINIHKTIIDVNSSFDFPHCMMDDWYDWYVYQQFPKMIVGEEISHINLFHILKQKGSSLTDKLFNIIQVFSDKEIYEFGYNPPIYNLKKENIDHLQAFIEVWWTLTNRHVFFESNHISPYLLEEAWSFYRKLPYEFKHNKKMKLELAKRRLPPFIYNRKKREYDPSNPDPNFYQKHKDQYENLINIYLKDKNRSIFKYLEYDLVQKHLWHYKKMWVLLNFSVWLELNT